MPAYEVTADVARFDIDAIHAALSQMYWSIGVPREIVERAMAIVAHPELQGLRRWLLATRDAHGLYAQFGFTPLSAPDRLMEIVRPNLYRTGDAPSA